MKNPVCNLSEEEQVQAFAAFSEWLDQDEEAVLSLKFTQYCFYESYGMKNYRACCCTRCGYFEVYKDGSPGFFLKHHGESVTCPNCGDAVTLYALGRMRNGNALHEAIRVAIVRKAPDVGVQLVAGMATKDYSPDCLQPGVTLFATSKTYLAPGKRMQWTRASISHWNLLYYVGDWHASKTVHEPFQPNMSGYYGDYFFLMCSRLAETSLRYSQVEEWYHESCAVWLSEEMEPVRFVYQYLARYTEYPQLEMAVKLGLTSAVDDLVTRGVKNYRYIDWSATNAHTFLRMGKADAKCFLRSGASFGALTAYKDVLKAGAVKSVDEFLRMAKVVGDAERLSKAAICGKLAGVDLRRAVSYVSKSYHAMPLWRVLLYWKDYLNAAIRLGYDLTNATVAMPKDLVTRHDQATELLQLQVSEAAREAYKRRYKALKEMYEFQLDGFGIYVPETAESIIEEGKTLRHCVGGYADRHLNGKVDILFLRHVKKPGRSYITIEMRPRKDTRSNVNMVQIHGYRNDMYSETAPNPEERYAWFLSVWMDWLRSGSKRDKNGKPILPEGMERTA